MHYISHKQRTLHQKLSGEPGIKLEVGTVRSPWAIADTLCKLNKILHNVGVNCFSDFRLKTCAIYKLKLNCKIRYEGVTRGWERVDINPQEKTLKLKFA